MKSRAILPDLVNLILVSEIILSILDKLAECTPVTRKVWMNKPNIQSWKFRHSPTYGTTGLLLYNYEETDAALRERMKQKIEEKRGENEQKKE